MGTTILKKVGWFFNGFAIGAFIGWFLFYAILEHERMLSYYHWMASWV